MFGRLDWWISASTTPARNTDHTISYRITATVIDAPVMVVKLVTAKYSTTPNAAVLRIGATETNPDSGEFADAMRERTALAHYGRPQDIASAVAYLASPEAGFITGISWNVDGGFAA